MPASADKELLEIRDLFRREAAHGSELYHLLVAGSRHDEAGRFWSMLSPKGAVQVCNAPTRLDDDGRYGLKSAGWYYTLEPKTNAQALVDRFEHLAKAVLELVGNARQPANRLPMAPGCWRGFQLFEEIYRQANRGASQLLNVERKRLYRHNNKASYRVVIEGTSLSAFDDPLRDIAKNSGDKYMRAEGYQLAFAHRYFCNLTIDVFTAGDIATGRILDEMYRERVPSEVPPSDVEVSGEEFDARSASDSVVLRGSREHPTVKGRKKPKLTASRYKLVKLLIEAGPDGLNKDAMENEYGGARVLRFHGIPNPKLHTLLLPSPAAAGGKGRRDGPCSVCEPLQFELTPPAVRGEVYSRPPHVAVNYGMGDGDNINLGTGDDIMDLGD